MAKVSQKQQTSQQNQPPVSLESDFPSLSLSSPAGVNTKSTQGVWVKEGSTPSSIGSDKVPTNCSTSTAPSSDPPEKIRLPYTISKTKKGSLPIRLESRNKGKKVTVIFNVTGDAKELLKELKHAAGCGGVIRLVTWL